MRFSSLSQNSARLKQHTARLRQHTVRLKPPAAALVALSGISTQGGSALATKLIARIGPAGTLTLRLLFATLALCLLVRPRARDARRLLHRSRRRDLAVVALFGVVLAAMNLSFYEAIARIPLGVAVTVEFVGPLAIAVAGSRRWSDGLWALLAASGVLLLTSGSLFGVVHHLDMGGVGFALLAGCCWAAYILVNKETGKRFRGTSGLLGASHAGAVLAHPSEIGIGAAVALLSSAIPYSCEMAALRRATPRAFGILLSMAPGLAALAGLVILGQRLSVLEVGALVLVVAANVGSAAIGTRTADTLALDVGGPVDPDPAGPDTAGPDIGLPDAGIGEPAVNRGS